MHRFFIFAILPMNCAIAHAQVQWTQRTVELRPKPDEPQVVATFPFTNT